MSTTVEAAAFAEAERVQRFWDEHYESLLASHAGQFVAVDLASECVVASNADLALLMYELRNRGIEPGTGVAIQLISEHARSLLL